MYARPGAAKLLLRPGSELLLHLNHGGEEDDDNDDDDDYDDDYDDYHNNVYVYICVCAVGCSGAIAGGTFCPSPRHSPNTTTEKRVPVLARRRSDGRLVVAREGHGVFTVSHYRLYHKTCRLGAKENGPS